MSLVIFPPTFCFRTELRLVNGSSRCSGRVEIFHDQQWGTVCDDRWSSKHAEVVCRELGCGVPLKAHTKAFYGQGTGPIWLDDVNCQGTEAALRECTASAWGHNNCNHREDAGVECAGTVCTASKRLAPPSVACLLPHGAPGSLHSTWEPLLCPVAYQDENSRNSGVSLVSWVC